MEFRLGGVVLFRFLDDVVAMNDGGENVYNEIYHLELKREQIRYIFFRSADQNCK